MMMLRLSSSLMCILTMGCMSNESERDVSASNNSSLEPFRNRGDQGGLGGLEDLASLEDEMGGMSEMSVLNDATLIIDSMTAPMTDQRPVEVDIHSDPCAGMVCSGHGVCRVTQDHQAQCDCEPRYDAIGLTCIPEDIDGDGYDFLSDCNDLIDEINPGAPERCDRQDIDCDGRIDEGACSMWVLEPNASEWSSYALNAMGDGHIPQETIKAAWDIESLDLAFVLTETAFHVFNIRSLTWEGSGPRDEIFTGLPGAIRGGAYAYSVPAAHTSTNFETVTITVLNDAGESLLWQIKYLIDDGIYERHERWSYGDLHTWRDINAPSTNQIRAAWMDVSHTRGWFNINPERLCEVIARSSDVYLNYMTTSSLSTMESGYCFTFTSPTPLFGSPLDVPGAPNFSEVGAAFWHRNTLYLFRGD